MQTARLAEGCDAACTFVNDALDAATLEVRAKNSERMANAVGIPNLEPKV